MTYTPEQRAADIIIAKAMWKHGNFVALGKMGDAPQVAEFHADHNAKHALLTWLAADEKRWHRFDHAFFEQFIGQRDLDFVQIAFLATPAQVAEAALRVIKEMK